MKISILGRDVVLAVALITSAACGGGMPNASSGVQNASSRIASDAKPYDLSGYYKGIYYDKGSRGTGKATASFSQYKSGVGGLLTIAYPKLSVTASAELSISGSNAKGTTVEGVNTPYCTYSTTSTYDYTKKLLTGSYKVVPGTGCTGDHGTFTLHHECTYRGNDGEDIRPTDVPHPC
jgi:hypothetical protein